MSKYLFYAMRGEKMCFLHVLMNALDLHASGHDVKIIFEGEAVKLPAMLVEENNKLYTQALEKGLIAGICEACSAMMGVLEENRALGLKLLSDMNKHAAMKPYAEEGYQIIAM